LTKFVGGLVCLYFYYLLSSFTRKLLLLWSFKLKVGRYVAGSQTVCSNQVTFILIYW